MSSFPKDRSTLRCGAFSEGICLCGNLEKITYLLPKCGKQAQQCHLRKIFWEIRVSGLASQESQPSVRYHLIPRAHFKRALHHFLPLNITYLTFHHARRTFRSVCKQSSPVTHTLQPHLGNCIKRISDGGDFKTCKFLQSITCNQCYPLTNFTVVSKPQTYVPSKGVYLVQMQNTLRCLSEA